MGKNKKKLELVRVAVTDDETQTLRAVVGLKFQGDRIANLKHVMQSLEQARQSRQNDQNGGTDDKSKRKERKKKKETKTDDFMEVDGESDSDHSVESEEDDSAAFDPSSPLSTKIYLLSKLVGYFE